MKTKTLFATLLFAVAVVLNSCGLPDGATNDDMKAWVFGHCLSNQLGNEYVSDYVLSLREHGEALDIVADDKASHIMASYFQKKFYFSKWDRYDDEDSWMKRFTKKDCARHAFRYDSDADWWSSLVGKTNEDRIKNLSDEEFNRGMRKIYRGFLSYLKDLAVDNVEVVDYTMSDFGDSYTKYDIIYSVGQDFYAKVSFIDMEKRYEWELVKTATRLNEILK